VLPPLAISSAADQWLTGSGYSSSRGIDRPSSCTIGPGTLCPVERHFFTILCEEVLPKELPHVLERVTKTPDDGKIAPHRMLGLGHVDDEHHGDSQQEQANDKDEYGR